MRQPSILQLNRQVDDFNSKYKVGDIVKLKLDSGEVKEVKLRTEAYVASGCSAVAFFEGIRGYYLIDRVKGRAEV
jgi:hypothetical protein